MRIKEIKVEKALSKTSINLADRVINPYRGCEFGCLYCYASKTKKIIRSNLTWGSFVDVKMNAPEIMEKELKEKSDIKKILLSSTTEPYQPLEEKYKLTRKILEIIKLYNKEVIILTRSTLIKRDISLLKNIKHTIFYTITPQEIYKTFETKSPDPKARLSTLELLLKAKLNVIPYVCPIVPGFFDSSHYFDTLSSLPVTEISFENINLKVLSNDIFFEKAIGNKSLLLSSVYSCEKEYNRYWSIESEKIYSISKKYNMRVKIHIHKFDDFCKIDYKK
jgi:DNA repair photolyase